ncbi:transporter substrate-binding domain-containing protein [Halobacteriovorax sp. GB3]|nr:transporter substrate-binding domain-containing protein [Halobacteriovorax sp. GB3]MDD0854350.1 transporter substrate-binding domain-containing protein [Halobacteriovorax sp. GB3]
MQYLRLFTLLFLITAPSFANEITVLGDSFHPLSFQVNGVKQGKVYEMVEKIIKKSGLKVKKNIITSWEIVYDYALKNPNVLFYTIVRTKEREDKFHWIGRVSDRRMFIYALKKRKDISIKRWQDLEAYKTLSLRKATVTDYISKRGAQIYPTTDLKQAYKMLINERAELMVMLDYSKDHLDKKNLVKPVWEIDQPGSFYVAMSKQTPEYIVKKVRQAYLDLKRKRKIIPITRRD